MRIEDFKVSPLRAPLVQPFRTALGDHDSLENFLVKLTLADGSVGLGEAAVATHITGETLLATQKNLERVGQWLIGRDAGDYLSLSFQLHEQLADNKCALAAIETALVDALTRSWKIPLWRFFGSRSRRLSSDITIVIADLKETKESAVRFYRQGFRVFKIKIGRDQDLDLQRVVAVHQAAPKAAICLDANQGYDSSQTLRFLKQVARTGLRPQLIEQPVAGDDWEGLLKVTRESKVPVCADESVRSLSDAQKVIRQKAAHVINIKLMKTGILESREIANLAKLHSVKLMIGGMMETSLAMTASAHMAAGLGYFDYVDLDTPFFIKGAAAKNPCLNSRGVYDLSGVKKGIGVRV